MGGWEEKWILKLTSAKDEVEVEAELGNNIIIPSYEFLKRSVDFFGQNYLCFISFINSFGLLVVSTKLLDIIFSGDCAPTALATSNSALQKSSTVTALLLTMLIQLVVP